MSAFLLVAAVLFPLGLAAVWPLKECRAWVGRLTAWAALPGMLLALLTNEFSIELPWLLLGSRWGLDGTGRVFLAFTATLWLAAGVFGRSYLAADPARNRFELFYLLTLAGNLGVTIAQDMVSFLFFFTLMSFSAYGLITHNREAASIRAGQAYIVLAVFGEVLLFWAVVLTAQQTGTFYFDGLAEKLAASSMRQVVVGLVLVGFGIKLGVMPLHFWLPLAHPAAPTPASAVLSGAMIKTGLLGMLRFLPIGVVAMHEWGAICITLGIASALLAVLIGLTQDNPKTVLAYSSVSQMGLISVGIGSALIVPSAWKVAGAALSLFAVHHAIAKAALFLGVGVAQAELRARWQRILVATGLVVASLSLAGLPFTTGFVTKSALKYTAAATAEPWATALSGILPMTGVTTTLLISRFLWLVWPSRQHSRNALTPAMAIPWGVLTAGVAGLFFVLRSGQYVKPTWVMLGPEKLWAAAWPILTASSIMALLAMLPALRSTLKKVHIPAGDLLMPLIIGLTSCHRVWQRAVVTEASPLIAMQKRLQAPAMRAARTVLGYANGVLETDLSTGLFIGVLALVVFLLVFFAN